jgi:hypothetical protein
MWKAWTATRHFELEAYGDTKQNALDLLGEMWAKWIEASGATIAVEELIEDASVMEVENGCGYFDYELYHQKQ